MDKMCVTSNVFPFTVEPDFVEATKKFTLN